MASFTCEVCFEEKEREARLELKELKTGNGDVLRTSDCQHPICRDCLATYVRVRVEEQRVFNIFCPHLGCKNQLYEADVQSMVRCGLIEQEVSKRFAEFRARDYTARLCSFAEVLPKAGQDYSLIREMYETVRLCPRCSVVIQKSQGCNSFYCICGHHFDYGAAPRVLGNGVKRYTRVIAMAERLKLPLSEAEEFGGRMHDYLHASRVASLLGVSLQEAGELLRRVKEGDQRARQRIREAKEALQQCEARDGDVEDQEVPAEDLFLDPAEVDGSAEHDNLA